MPSGINLRLGIVTAWPVLHSRVFGLHSILMIFEQAKIGENEVLLTEYLTSGAAGLFT